MRTVIGHQIRPRFARFRYAVCVCVCVCVCQAYMCPHTTICVSYYIYATMYVCSFGFGRRIGVVKLVWQSDAVSRLGRALCMCSYATMYVCSYGSSAGALVW